MNLKKSFFKYLTIGEEEKDWGIYVTGAGHVEVSRESIYPLLNDPTHHYFHYSMGRRLSDYQIIYITKGRGVFESELSGCIKVSQGDIFILFPNVWHRFKPDSTTGWDEYWVEFNGDVLNQLDLRHFVNPKNPVETIGISCEIVSKYLKILELIQDEKPGFQYIVSGILMQLIGEFISTIKYKPFDGKKIEAKIRQAKLKMFENIGQVISQKELAENLGLSYSLYRKKFKEYTGMPPTQYHIQLRMRKAKELLVSSELSIKEIVNKLSPNNMDYFFRLFKEKTGYTPMEYRKKFGNNLYFFHLL